MSSDSTINFFTTVINFMHEEFIKTSPLYSKELEIKVGSGPNSLSILTPVARGQGIPSK